MTNDMGRQSEMGETEGSGFPPPREPLPPGAQASAEIAETTEGRPYVKSVKCSGDRPTVAAQAAYEAYNDLRRMLSQARQTWDGDLTPAFDVMADLEEQRNREGC